MEQHWNNIYTSTIEEAVDRIGKIPGVVLGFHSTIDGLKRIEPVKVETALKEHAPKEQLPIEINDPADLMTGMLHGLIPGKALQLMIRNENTFRWLMEAFGYDELRMGGTSGNMANALSPLNFQKILVYANPLTKEQAQLFNDDENLLVLKQDADGSFQLHHPHQAWEGEGIKALHWILEYPQGVEITTAQGTITTPRANRYIAAWNPVNNKLQITETFKQGLLATGDQFSHFIVSGFHILSETYPDGSTYLDCLRPVADFLRELRQAHPHLKLHYEFASIASSKIRKGILTEIIPLVDSLGLNEVELVALLKDLDAADLASRIQEHNRIGEVLAGTVHLMKKLNINRIQLHDLGYYLCLTKPGFVTPSRTRQGLVLAATLAAARTKMGRISGPQDIFTGLEVPLSQEGLDRLAELAELCGESLAKEGTTTYEGFDLAYLPTKVVERPVLTVGLGDLISSTGFILGT